MGYCQRHTENKTKQLLQQSLFKFSQNEDSSNAVSLELTFAGLHALKPAVISVPVASTSAVLKPSTARSATTLSAGFLERATLSARHRISDRWRAD